MAMIVDDSRDPVKFQIGEKIRYLQENDPEQLREMLETLTPEEAHELQYDDEIMLREKQWIPLDAEEDTILLLAGRGFGKLVEKTEEIHTLTGWKTIGEVEIGDQVFDEQGNPCTVIDYQEPEPTKAYEIEFDTGEKITVDADHLWTTWTHRDRKQYHRLKLGKYPKDWYKWSYKGKMNKLEFGPKTRTTQEIYDTFYQATKRGDLNHSIPVCSPLQFPKQEVPIDPYVLGAWLGDGSHSSGSLTNPEEEIINRIRERGFEVTSKEVFDKDNYIRGFVGHLRKYGLWKNKHVPEVYLNNSEEVRLDILRGLMDTDGYIEHKNGTVEFCQMRKHIAESVKQIAASFGEKVTMYEGEAKIYEKEYGTKYRVSWKVNVVNPFSLTRKKEIADEWLNKDSGQKTRSQQRMMRSIKEVPIPECGMRCLSVDSPSNLFLVGRTYIPTHNSHSLAATIKRAVEKHSVKQMLIIAPTARTLSRTIAPAIIGRYPPGHENIPRLRQGFMSWPNGAELLMIPAEAGEDAPRSANVELLFLEEAAFYENNSGIITQAELTCRLPPAKTIIATTPKATEEMIDWVTRYENGDPTIRIINGSTLENKANLSDKFTKTVIAKYKGTRLEQTELEGKLILENEDALFQMGDIQNHEITNKAELPKIVEISIGVDPAVNSKQSKAAVGKKKGRKPDSVGIIVSGLGDDGLLYCLENHTKRYGSGVAWTQRVCELYDNYAPVAKTTMTIEVNAIGMEYIQKGFTEIGRNDVGMKFKPYFSTESKLARLAPYALMHDQGKIKWYNPDKRLEDLFRELTTFTGTGASPNAMDAFVFSVMPLSPSKISYAEVYDLIV